VELFRFSNNGIISTSTCLHRMCVLGLIVNFMSSLVLSMVGIWFAQSVDFDGAALRLLINTSELDGQRHHESRFLTHLEARKVVT
jgi:hypothetical protein